MLLPDTKPPFRFWTFFFSPHGRVSRKAIWLFVGPIHTTFFAVSWIIPAMLRTDIANGNLQNSPWILANAFLGLFILVLAWPMFAVIAKRLHDLGWIAAFGTAQLVGLALGMAYGAATVVTGPQTMSPVFSITTMVLAYYHLALIALLAILPGTKGANRFGPPPGSLAPEAAQHF